MKVLMIDQWLPSQPYTQELARELCQHVELTVAAPRYYRPEGERFRYKNVLESKAKKSGIALLRYFAGVLWLYGAALFGRYDVIHVQALKKWQFEMPPFELATRLGKKKLVYTAHNILPHEHNSRREAAALRKWYRRCDAILVHNESSRKVLLDFEPSVADRVHIIPHGCFDNYAHTVVEQPHEKTVFLQFGAIRKYKGIDTLLQEAALLDKEIREQIRIVIVGNQRPDLDDTDYQALLEQAGVQSFVTFERRFVPDDELPSYFNTCDCCLFPYKEIYGSGALLLAYSFEKPVIASAIPTFVEETDNGAAGLLYDPESPGSLAAAISRFLSLSPADRQAMKQEIRRLCLTKYSWRTSAEQLARVYHQITSSAEI